MCGLAGILATTRNDLAAPILHQMSNTIFHRGPDSTGTWLDESQGIGLTHRRLSILDLSPAGNQPMASANGRYVIAFNGEIYNHLLLRKELEKSGWQHAWRGHSDTETLLAAFCVWGIEEAIKRCTGMFAFALWDKQKNTLTLGRDRIGEKPLYYGWLNKKNNPVFLFASELKALQEHPAFNANINRDALSLFMRYSYIPAPYSIYNGICKLMPGTLLTVSRHNSLPQVTVYWSAVERALNGKRQVFSGTPEEAVGELETVLKSVIKQQMISDAPLGAFLSGGIDSSTVVSLMQSQSGKPIKTFTIGFNEEGYNEAVHAKAVAKYLKTEHTELYITPDQAMEVIPRLPEIFCEPFADASQIPTHLVSLLARRHVAVALSGDAGDEFFSGYNRYILTNQLWKKISAIPKIGRKAIANTFTAFSPKTLDTLLSPVREFLPASLKLANLGNKLHKSAAVLGSGNIDELYLNLVSHWNNPTDIVIGSKEPPTLLKGNTPELANLEDIHRMMLLDCLTYLPDNVLVKVDRAAMSVSLESRAPFLDHRIVELAWRMPLSLKLRDNTGKWLLRQVLYRYVPKELVERPKMGFSVPIDSWLRGPLKEWAESLLNESRLKTEGFLNPAPIREKWIEHLSGKRNWQYHLWNILMFQAWLEKQLQKKNAFSEKVL